MKILVTGSTGFIGRNMKEFFFKQHQVFAPTHEELDLTDLKKVKAYFKENRPQFIIHCAGKEKSPCLKENLEMFYNLLHTRYEHMFIMGSGADDQDTQYGLSKYTMSRLAGVVSRVTYLRLYGVFGKYEDYNRRFISQCIIKKLNKKLITIPEDRSINYVYVNDLCRIIDLMIKKPPYSIHYNVCSTEWYTLSQIAKIIGVKCKVTKEGKLYGGVCQKLKQEYKFEFTPLRKAVIELEKYYEKHPGIVSKEKAVPAS